MAYYPYCLSLNRLRLQVNLGYYGPERDVKQPIEITLRMYFAAKPGGAVVDGESFIDYDGLSDALKDMAATQQFRLIEFMANALLGCARSYVDTAGFRDVKLWLQLTKCEAPVDDLMGGSSFTVSDLPVDATYIASH